MGSIPELLKTINQHTGKLIDEEISHWQERADKDTGETVERYLSRLTWIRNEVTKCDGSCSCILRVGHGSGWRFITGAWTEGLGNFTKEVIPASRPGNQKYESYAFPKTRRISTEHDLLGFVRLTGERCKSLKTEPDKNIRSNS
ncbi:MAG: hypothetical protein LIP08_04815 [Bacteroides sp.]|nr:hypothetical protein [Bacteroides sp.]